MAKKKVKKGQRELDGSDEEELEMQDEKGNSGRLRYFEGKGEEKFVLSKLFPSFVLAEKLPAI